tara:strand:+ start:507 stop:821 length:315 start_codon:yes stop_codon:yes gene_type:complete
MFKTIQIEGATTAFFNGRIRGELPDGYSFYIPSDDFHIELPNVTIDFILLDEGPHVTDASAVGTFTITFHDADDIALNILQALEYHDMLDQVTILETELMFPAS